MTLRIELLKLRLLLFIGSQLAVLASQAKGITAQDREEIATEVQALKLAVDQERQAR